MNRTPTALLAVGLLLGLLSASPGCPAPTYEFHFDYTGEPGVAVPITFYSDVPLAEVALDGGEPMDFLIDTGAPATILDLSVFGLNEGVIPTETVETLGITVLGLECAALNLFGGSLDVGGIVGGDILRNFALTLDYRGALATLFVDLDGQAPPGGTDLGPAASTPFDLRGGGLLGTSNGALRVAPTRVVLTLNIEGHDVLAVLDTGASSVVLDENLYWELLEWRPERPVLEGFEVLTVDSAQDAVITRVASVSVSGPDGPSVAQQSVPALVILGSNALQHLSAETGRQVRVLLGGAFLRFYQVTIDYPAERLTLQPYLNPDHVDPEEYMGVGFTYEQISIGNVVVDAIIPGSDAEQQGVAEGDRILTAGPYNILLTGEGGIGSAVNDANEGDTVTFTLERNDATALYDIVVEDLLPPFQ